MKAVVLRSNGKLVVEEMELPTLEADECRVRVHAAGVCSSDFPRGFEGGAYNYPLVMGHEVSGEVVESKSDRFKPGDHVALFPLIPCGKCDACKRKSYVQCAQYDYYGSRRNGGFAEYLNVKAWNLFPLPSGVGLLEGALIEPTAVVVHALRRADLFTSSPEVNSVAILGGGFLGQIAARILKLKRPDLKVSLIDRNPSKIEAAQAYCTETSRLASQEEWNDYLASKGESFDAVLEACGAPQTFQASIRLARPSGSVYWMGNIADDLKMDKKLVSSILRKELRILGSWNSDYEPDAESDWTETAQLLKEGLEVQPLANERPDLETLPEAMAKLYDRRTRGSSNTVIKILMDAS